MALLGALSNLARKHLKVPARVARDSEDLAQEVLVNLLQSGPRELESVPATEPRLLGFLRACLTNKLRDHIRKADSREAAQAGWEQVQKLRPTEQERTQEKAAAAAAAAARRKQYAELERRVREIVVPRARAAFSRRNARSAFDAAIKEVLRLASSDLDMRELVAREGADADRGAEFERVRARIYRRHTRVRERLLSAIAALREEGSLSEEDAGYAGRYVASYLNRQTGS